MLGHVTDMGEMAEKGMIGERVLCVLRSARRISFFDAMAEAVGGEMAREKWTAVEPMSRNRRDGVRWCWWCRV